MTAPEQVLSSWDLRKQWGWSDEDLLEAMRMGLPGYEAGTKRALAAEDISRFAGLVKTGGTIHAHYKPADIEQFQCDHRDIFPRGVQPKRPSEISPRGSGSGSGSGRLQPPDGALQVSVEQVAERWACAIDQVRCLVADGLLPPPEGAGPEGWFDRNAFQEGSDTPPSNFEIFKAERAWGKTVGWRSDAIQRFEEDHPGLFESEQMASMPEVTRSSPPATSADSSGSPPRTGAKPPSPARGDATPADEPAPAKEGDVPRDAADAPREITTEDLETAVEVAIELCRWWEKQPEHRKRPAVDGIAHVKTALAHLCNKMSETRLKMIAAKANPRSVEKRPSKRN